MAKTEDVAVLGGVQPAVRGDVVDSRDEAAVLDATETNALRQTDGQSAMGTAGGAGALHQPRPCYMMQRRHFTHHR